MALKVLVHYRGNTHNRVAWSEVSGTWIRGCTSGSRDQAETVIDPFQPYTSQAPALKTLPSPELVPTTEVPAFII